MVPSVALLIIIIIGPQFLDVWLLGYPFIFAHIYYSNPIGFFFGLPFSSCQTMASNDIPACPSLDVPTNPKVAGMEISSLPMFKTPGGSSDPFYGWDPPLVSLTHSANFSGASSMPLEFSSLPYPLQTHRISGTPNTMVHYQSNLDLTNMVPKVPCFESESFSEIVESFGLPECAEHIPDRRRRCFPIHSSNEIEIQRTSSNGTQSQEHQISEERTPSGKRRKRGAPEASHSASNPHKSSDGEQQRDLFWESHELQEQQNDKKQKSKQDVSGVNSFGNQITKQSNKDNSPNGDAGKDIYVHRRAKRGQATNSHSLAERVRREKISDRMKMLQEIVPGCNKITGKAVMLDEIINYVQSLQQQVQFLSMKLATFNPELNMNIGQLVSKDILHSRVSNTTVLGFGHGMNFSRPFPHGISQGTLASIPSSTSQLQSMPHQGIWDTKLANAYKIGYGSNSANETDA